MQISWKLGFADQSLVWSRSRKHNRIQEAQKVQCSGCTFSPKLYSDWAKWCFSKTKNHPFLSIKHGTVYKITFLKKWLN